MIRRLLAAVLITATAGSAALGTSAEASGRDVFRVFVVGYKQTMANAESYDTFRASLEAWFERIEPKLLEDGPNIVMFPEATALTAWLIGGRGRQAREDGNTAVSAVASLGVTYAPQVSYYEGKCSVPPARALVLALTDTTWRAFGETLAELAKTYGVHVIANADIAASIRKVTDPAKVELLADPEISTDYAYEADCPLAYNQAYFFAPEGAVFEDDGSMPVGTPGAQIRGIVPKAYLVPIERDQSVGLALSSAAPSQVRPVDLGFASFGVFTSKDAWMSDLPNRNDVDGAQVFVQPEAGAWAGWSESSVRDWPQVGIHRSTWGMVQKLPHLRFGALTNLIGNFHDLPFDGTPTITTDASYFRPAGPGGANRRHYLLGRRIMDGILARSSWVVPDPGPSIRFGDWKERRRYLQSQGAKRAPGSGAPEENAYLDDAFVWADLPVTQDRFRAVLPDRVPYGRSRIIAASEAAQWEPSLDVADDGTLLAAWTDLRDGDEDPLVAKRTAKGWSAPVSAGPDDSSPNDQTDSQYGVVIGAGRNKVHAVWVDFRNQSWDVRAATAPVHSLEFSDDVRVDHSRSSAEGYPNENLHNDPAIALLPDGTALAAWDDLRARRPDRDIRVASLTRRKTRWQGDGLPSLNDRAEQFHPDWTVNGRGKALLVWQDHRGGRAAVRMVVPSERGYRRPLLVSERRAGVNAFTPQIEAGDGLVVAWAAERNGDMQIEATTRWRGRFSKPIRVAPSEGSQSYPSLISVPGHGWIASWTQTGREQHVLAAALSARNGTLRVGKVFRFDDSGKGARMSVLAYHGCMVWAAWEDVRSGVEQIRVARTSYTIFFPPPGGFVPRACP